MAIQIKGTIGYVRNSNSVPTKSGFVDFTFHTADKDVLRQPDGSVLCSAIKSYVNDGYSVILTGDWDETNKFVCTDVEMTFLTPDIAAKFLKKQCKGVGAKKAEQIIDHFQDALFTISKEDMRSQLKENFPKFSNEIISAVVDATHPDKDALHRLERKLLPLGVKYETVDAIFKEYGNDSIAELDKNPYQVMNHLGLPYDAFEKYAYSIGMQPFDRRRLRGLCDHVIRQAESQGHTYVDSKKFAERVNRCSEKGAYGISIDPVFVSTTVSRYNALHYENQQVSRMATFLAEQNSAKRIATLMQYSSDIVVEDKHIIAAEKDLGITYGNGQKEAFRCLQTGSVNIITGGPGTGKTTIIRGIVHVFLQFHPDATVAFAAPTGRAAKRLAESTGYPAQTIHKLLNYTQWGDVVSVKNSTDPIVCDLLIIDETSMIDVFLFDMLTCAIAKGTKVLFVGDENQLPSIDAGNILHDMIESGVIPVYRLTENFRQGKGELYDNSIRILEGKIPVHNGNDVCIYKVADENEAKDVLIKLMDRYYDHSQPYKVQMIEPAHGGAAGTNQMNSYMHQKVHGNVPNLSKRPMINDKIIFTRTAPDRRFVNGEMGIIKQYTSEDLTVETEDNTITIPISSMEYIRFGYSYTIHKSQGSENEHIIMYLPEEEAHMVTKALLYTAFTRAKKRVTVVYTGNALAKGVRNVQRRNTNFKTFLLAEIGG